MNRVCILAALSAGVFSSFGLADVTGITGNNAPVPTVQPSLGINYLIRTSGFYPSDQGSPVGSIGEIIQFAGNFVPDGYAAADGHLLPISQNTALFSLLGTSWGGNGQTTFAVPDLRGRAAIGAGQGAGLSNYDVGETVGVEQLTLNVSNLTPHSHTLPTNPVSNTSITGGAVPYTTMQPSAALHYIVPLEGIYPSQGGGGPVSSSPVLGFVYATASFNAQNIWTTASGQLLPINQNDALFSILGTTYGGDGVTTFALPDLRGRAPIGVGQGPGLSPQALGETIGTETSTMTLAQMPNHDHTIANPPTVTGFTGGSQPQSTLQPTLALHPIIAINGLFPSRLGGSGDVEEPLLGQIDLFAGNFAPSGWAFANGQLLSIAQNTALFAILGTTYGGNGVTTFALPNLQGRLGVGFGQGAGLSNVDLGQSWGAENVTFNVAQLPAHTHNFDAIPEPGSLGLIVAGVVGMMMRRRRSSAETAR